MMGRHLPCWILALSIATYASPARADIELQSVRLVDVTPFAFSLIWQAGVPSDPRVEIYADADGTTDITAQLETIRFPLRGGDPEALDPYLKDQKLEILRARQAAQGLMQVRIEGAVPGTTYYYRVISETAGDQSQWPIEGLASVRTPMKNSFLVNATQLLVTVAEPDAAGWLVTAHVQGIERGTSAIVGDGTAPNQAFVDLGRLFAADTLNWAPSGSESVTVEITRGWNQTTTQTFELDVAGDYAVVNVQPVAFGLPLAAQFEPSTHLVQQPEPTEVELVLGDESATAAQAIEVSFASVPAGLTIEARDLPAVLEAGQSYRSPVTLTPPAVGTYTVTATVTPEVGTPTVATLNVRFLDPALAPQIVSVETDPEPTEGAIFWVRVEAVDPDDDLATLSYAIDRDRDGDFDETKPQGEFAFQLPDDGDYPIRVAVIDPAGGRREQDALLQVANAPPQFTSLPPQDALEGAPYDYAPEVIDPGTDDVVLSLDGPPRSGARPRRRGALDADLRRCGDRSRRLHAHRVGWRGRRDPSELVGHRQLRGSGWRRRARHVRGPLWPDGTRR